GVQTCALPISRGGYGGAAGSSLSLQESTEGAVDTLDVDRSAPLAVGAGGGAVQPGRGQQVLEQVAPLLAAGDLQQQTAQERARPALHLAEDLGDVGPGVEGAGGRVVGVEEVVQRERGDVEHLGEGVALLDQDAAQALEAGDVLPQRAAVLPDEGADLAERDPEVVERGG